MTQNIWIDLITGYLVLINLIAVIVTVADKSKAKRGKWRVKERTLLLLSALGGSIGMYITMHIVRHKTKKLKFMLGIPLIFLAQITLIWGGIILFTNGWSV